MVLNFPLGNALRTSQLLKPFIFQINLLSIHPYLSERGIRGIFLLNNKIQVELIKSKTLILMKISSA